MSGRAPDWSNYPLDSLRFYLNGESAAVHTLYEFLFLNTLRIACGRCLPAKGLPRPSCRRAAFSRWDSPPPEGILPYSDRSFLGYRLLQEYFSFPEKFFFVDLKGLDRLAKRGFGSAFEILIFLKEPDQPHRLIALEQSVGSDTFQLGCTPIVNLFERIAEPIRITQTKAEYQIIPDQHRQWALKCIPWTAWLRPPPTWKKLRIYEPFYALAPWPVTDDATSNSGTRTGGHRFRKNDNGTEVYLSLVDLDFNPALPPVEMLTLHVTCTNRDQAALPEAVAANSANWSRRAPR